MSPDEPLPQLSWVRPPVQGRSQRTLQQLLDATEQLLQRRPFEQVSVQDIVKRARSSVGSFYGRFPGKEALLHSLVQRYVAESRATADGALSPDLWADVELERVIEALCGFMVAYQRDHSGLRRAILSGMVHNRELRRQAIELTVYVSARMARLLEQRKREFTHPNPARAAGFIHRIVFSVLDQVLIFGDESPTGEPLSDEQLVAELTRTCVGYLGIEQRTGRRRHARTTR